ncbi:LuxR C-terminal-related transcriptional regulator [Chloroflexota bacterium]
MDTSLLKTKLHMPRLRPEIVSRPRLLEKLKTGLQHKLTLIAAPAGYGKTTLLSEGVHSSQTPVGWLTLDEDDNDPTRFWLYVISAMQTVRADMGKSALDLLQSSQPPPIESILTIIINEMSEVSDEFALVLDDYHTIDTPAIHDSVNFLLNHLPPQAHLVIASRTNPPIPLAQMRAQNQLMEVRAADLRFIPEEATAFLNDVMSLGLSNEDVAALESRTEGWIASLQLAAVSMQGREDISTFIAEFSGSNRYILDYLIEEVLRRQDTDTQSFLLETAILDRFTASLCNAVTGRDDSREGLAQLEATNLFLVPLDDERQWYRYHHLFADLLRNQLLHSQQGRMTELHLRASRWFEQEGLISEAITHTLGAKDFERAASLVESVAPTMIMQSYCLTVLSWLEQLPSELIADRPWLCLYGARANQLIGNQDVVDLLLQSAESAMSRAEEEHPAASFLDHARIRGGVMVVRSTTSLLEGDAQYTIELCYEALKYLPEDDLAARAATAGNLGLAYFVTGELPVARRYFEEANTLGQVGGYLYYALFAMSYLGDILRVQGHLYQAAEKYREALRLGSQWGNDGALPATGAAYVSLSQVLYEWNDIDRAIHHVSIGIKLAERGGVIRPVVIGYSFLAWQNQSFGNTKAMTEALQRVEDIPTKSVNLFTLIHTSAWKARLSLAQGDLNSANRWAISQEPKLKLQDMPDFWSELSYLTLVRLRIAQGEIDEIPGLLEQLSQKVESEERTGSLIEILALQSIALQAKGDLDQALATLERALSLAEPEGYVRTFVDEGEPMAKLLRLAASRGIAKKYVKKLLASFQRPILGAESQLKVLPDEGAVALSPVIESLSERELEVLRLIVAGMSNREIAEKLIIGEGTVKTHINNIYSKLDVQRRTQAIAQARKLRLL